jgi:hypothetical protein
MRGFVVAARKMDCHDRKKGAEKVKWIWVLLSRLVDGSVSVAILRSESGCQWVKRRRVRGSVGSRVFGWS